MTETIDAIHKRENKEETSEINEGNSLQSCQTVSLEENSVSMNEVIKEHCTYEGSLNYGTSKKTYQNIFGAVVTGDDVNNGFHINDVLKNWMMDVETNSASNNINNSNEEISMPSVKKLIQTFNEIQETSFSIKVSYELLCYLI